MKLFETAWRNEFQYFARYYDTDLQRSQVERIPGFFEYYVEDPRGQYTYLIDQSIKLTKRTGQRKYGIGKYGLTDPIYRHIRDYYWKDRQYNKNPKIWYLDIETRVGTCSEGFPSPDLALEPISLIQFFDNSINTMIILGLRDFKERDDYKLEYKVKYFKFNNEIDLLNGFIKIFNKLDPLIIYAWNGLNFDFPYLFNRCKNLGIDGLFNNYGTTKCYKKERDKGSINVFTSPGHVFYDMIDAYKFIVLSPRDSYSLDNIARVELNDNKIQHTEYVDFDSFYTGEKYQVSNTPYEDAVREEIRKLQIKRYNKTITELEKHKLNELISFQFVYYGIYDVYLLKKLDDKIKMSSIFANMASMMGAQFEDMLGTIKKWETYICNVIYSRSLIAPPIKENDNAHVVGGFVRDPVIGKHQWVLNADVNSMYPMLSIAAFNMSPETYVPIAKLPSDLREYILKYFNDQDENRRFEIADNVWNEIIKLIKKYDYAIGLNGACFKRDKIGIIPQLILEIYNNRKKAKKTMIEYHSQGAKLEEYLNSHQTFGPGIDSFKNVLDYKSFDELSKENIQCLINKCDELYQEYDVEQHTLKILMNSLYGALGNKLFLFFNEKIAQAITGNGRFFIKMLGENIERYYQKLKPYNGKYLIYGDTDSTLGTTKINVNDKLMSIAEVYSLNGKETEYKPGKFIKELDSDLLTDSINKNLQLEKKRINYVMKHKVKKHMFKIKVNGNEVIITEDHSLVVLRAGKLHELKPSEIKKTDKIICL